MVFQLQQEGQGARWWSCKKLPPGLTLPLGPRTQVFHRERDGPIHGDLVGFLPLRSQAGRNQSTEVTEMGQGGKTRVPDRRDRGFAACGTKPRPGKKKIKRGSFFPQTTPSSTRLGC